MQEGQTKELFKRLKIKTLLDLALILPKSYEDNRLSDSIEANSVVTVEATVEGLYPNYSGLRVKFYLPKFNRFIYAIFFRATSYHYGILSRGSKHTIKGRVTLFKRSLQITQPKFLKERECESIIPKYKSPIKEHLLKSLISTYIKRDNLIKEGLNSKEIKALLTLHFPMKEGWQNPTTDYSDRLIEILKSIEAFNHLKKLKSKREFYPAIKALRGDEREFIKSLPFTLTDDQKKTILEIKKDISREDVASRRVVIGDVGSGKTVIILASAVMAKDYGSILMAPTSVLANQLYQEAIKFLPKEMKTALFTQNRKVGGMESADFIVATHAILYSKNPPKVALVMVDEQHRFGSNQRATLETIFRDGERRPHYLQFSATPIPRTQAMIDTAMVDVSLIESTPFKRDMNTVIIGKRDFNSLLKHIENEIFKNHQILIIYPLVEESKNVPYFSIDEAREFWESRYDGVYVTHGKDKNKDEILERFRDDGKILLATTVVEVGISLPRLTIIVVVGAERLGLASLHQLRGRVGRTGLKSWCYLYTNSRVVPERLIKFAKTRDGFEIAKLDLYYRDSGDILDGTIQSGQKFKWLNLLTDEEIIQKTKERIFG
jgi:ATP-dependent DNA helicase RecG